MRTGTVLLASAIIAILVSPARADRASEFDQALQGLFDRIDTSANGLLEVDEITSFADQTFERLDSDADRRLTAAEFRSLDFGLSDLAERHGRAKLYADARERIWQRWRRPRPRQVTRAAFRQHVRGELLRPSRGSLGVTYAEFRRRASHGTLRRPSGSRARPVTVR